MNDHVYFCQNRKCGLRNVKQYRAEFKSDMRCSRCKQVMKYEGEQLRLALDTKPQPTLEERVAQLEKQVAELLAANPEAHMPALCQQHKCTYFMHYLAYGPADLTHEGFHAAEAHCTEVQLRIEKWMKEHPTDQIPEGMMRVASAWEARVRA